MNTLKTRVGLGCAIPALLALLSCPASGATLTLAATEDTFLSEHFPQPAGEQFDMVIGTQGTFVDASKNRGLVRFGDLSQIPAGATLTSVRFKLMVNKAPTGNPPADFRLNRLLKEWDETNSTWQLRLGPNQTWGEPGGASGTDFVADSSGSQQIGGNGSYFFESTPELIGDVTAWVNNPASNFGWLIKSADESEHNARRFGTIEGSGAPALEVTYEMAQPVVITGFNVDAGAFCLQFQVRPGKSYVVERRTSLDTAPWIAFTNLGPAAASASVTVCDPIGTPNGFYRLGEQ